MSRYLCDTSVLLRFLVEDDILHEISVSAVRLVFDEGNAIFFTPQIERESWSVLTRPKDVGGFGLLPDEADSVLEVARADIAFAADSPAVHSEWRQLVREKNVSGAKVHDANHVAAMYVHGLSHVLTFDARDFSRYENITVISPRP